MKKANGKSVPSEAEQPKLNVDVDPDLPLLLQRVETMTNPWYVLGEWRYPLQNVDGAETLLEGVSQILHVLSHPELTQPSQEEGGPSMDINTGLEALVDHACLLLKEAVRDGNAIQNRLYELRAKGGSDAS